MTWTPDQIETVKRLWLRGDTAAEISRAIGKSKNAVIGMAHRLKLPGRPSPIKRNPKPPATKRVYETRTADTPMPPVRKHDGASYIAAKPLKLAVPAKTKASKRPCQWIEGEPSADDACKCGEPCQTDSSFCPEHHERAYVRHHRVTPEGRAAMRRNGKEMADKNWGVERLKWALSLIKEEAEKAA